MTKTTDARGAVHSRGIPNGDLDYFEVLFDGSKDEVKVTKGSYANIKITTPEDLVIAEALLGRVNDIQ